MGVSLVRVLYVPAARGLVPSTKQEELQRAFLERGFLKYIEQDDWVRPDGDFEGYAEQLGLACADLSVDWSEEFESLGFDVGGPYEVCPLCAQPNDGSGIQVCCSCGEEIEDDEWLAFDASHYRTNLKVVVYGERFQAAHPPLLTGLPSLVACVEEILGHSVLEVCSVG